MHACPLVLIGCLTVANTLAQKTSVPAEPKPAGDEPAPAVSPLASRCATFEASVAKRFSRIKPRFPADFAEDGVEAFLWPMRRCVQAGRGAWLLQPHVSQEQFPEAQVLSGTLMPTYVAEDGKTTRASAKVDIGYASDPELGHNATPRIMPMMDYDGDGVSELILQVISSRYEEYEERYRVYTFRDGRVRIYPGLENIRIQEVGDYDRDGLLDVVTHASSPWTGRNCFGMESQLSVGLPPLLYHARSDGTFSPGDEVAAAYLREQCREPPATLIVLDDAEWEITTFEAIACARLWGASAKEVQRRLRREWGKVKAARRAHDFSDCSTSLADFERFARIDPPVVLEGP